MGQAIRVRTDYTAGEVRRACDTGERCRTSAAAVGDRGGARRGPRGKTRRRSLGWIARRCGTGSRSDLRAGADMGSLTFPPGRAAQARRHAQGPSSPGSWRRARFRQLHGVVPLAGLRSDHAIARGVWICGCRTTRYYSARSEDGLLEMPAPDQRPTSKDAEAMDAFKKTSPSAWRTSAAPHSRAGHTGRLVQGRDAGRPEEQTHPIAGPERAHVPAPATISTHPIRPICSARYARTRGAGAALVLPACNTGAMQLHLDEIPTRSPPAPTPFSSSIKPDGMARKT